MNGWIAVDLDGTLAHYDGWQGADHIGAPIPAMVERVKRWLAEGRDVRIFTARVSYPSIPAGSRNNKALRDAQERVKQAQTARVAIARWSEEHIGQRLQVTNEKDYAMIELWDDRAVQVIPNTGEPVGTSTRGLT